MGLVKRNYRVKSLGIILPTAYAKITKITVEKEKGTAEFSVQKDRASTDSFAPVEKVTVPFTVIRTENPFVTAYNEAKSVREKTVLNRENGSTEKIEMPSYFYGWEDDIVGEE